ncbi:hypothetical protein PDIDSM_6492 [Penicillium digitatum]|nr:hypothetical protein PDIDSM_6492 [Penicillium digitatum]
MGNKSSSASDEGFDETKDLEAANPTTLNEHFSCADANANRDPVLITWSGPDDLENPKNWQNAPARQDLDKALGMHSDIERYLSMAIVILTYSIGPIFFGPSSELYGRVRLLQISNVWCLAWNLGCGFAQTTSQLFAFRVLAGIATCGAPKNVARPWASTLLYSTWRWVFWATSAAAVGVQVAGLIWLRECHLSTILRKRRDARAEDGQPQSAYRPEATGDFVYDPAYRLLHGHLHGYLFGVTYLSHLRLSRTSGLGLSREHQQWRTELPIHCDWDPKVRNNNVGKPEYRIPSLALGSVVSTIGLFWYGWSIGHTHWIMSNIGALIFTPGTISCLQGMQTYIVDSYETYAACAILRSQCSFGFPLFAPSMYSSLGYGWCKSVQALIAMAIGWSAPFAFYFFWHKLRTASRHAAD